ncbi:class I SAM-dependent methyltransferase [Streptosporangium sp. NBC_01756]|uniref:class I SAM-dependent methyltransferase n=1 Tax=Streptosporangium sp. NBC_01756 TaxID=2975950 RepID=UPI002DD9822C|nr:class I SAM-dependent methyltransferase [Streptosporangium sp. NBC_01756]WSC84788.1 class I SAM-dependent methyltransferase [Streptosporangium sp. NBC_01756]
MQSVVNTHQAEAWNGYEGNHWADHQDRYDAVNSGFNDHLIGAAAIGERDRVLDIGCGNGQVTRLAARRARLGHTTGIDLAAPMLRRAEASAAGEGIANVAFERGDAQIHPFPDGGFDVALSRFGIMFFADPVAAFANIGRALRPGGRLAFLSLRDMGDNDLGPVLTAMARHLPARPASTGPGAAGPESLADPARIREVLTGAGFEKVTSTAVDAPQVWGRDAEDAGDFLGAWGPLRFMLDQVDEAAAARARAALTAALRPYEEPDAVRLRGAAWLVTATRP